MRPPTSPLFAISREFIINQNHPQHDRQYYCRFDDPVSRERAARPVDGDDDFGGAQLAMLVAGLAVAAFYAWRRRKKEAE